MSNERIYKIKRVGEYKVVYIIREYTEVMNNWEVKGKLIFNSFEDLKTYLIKNTDEIFGWINEDSDEYEELPNFNDVETIHDINTILDKYNYGWWFLNVETLAIEKTKDFDSYLNKKFGSWL